MTDKQIRDLPQYKKTVTETDGLLALAKLAKALEPFLPQKARTALSELDPQKLEQMRNDMEKLRNMPDRFNAHFSNRGWIAWEGMNVDVSFTAIELADQGKVEAAEEILVAYWTKEIIRHHITLLKRVNAFRPRWRMAVNAEALYAEGKYDACTLMVLAVLDGMVQEVSARHLGTNQNFSAEKTELVAWDSIAGHSSGLSKLKEILLASRKKTNTDPITIPYRHGIVHGMDTDFSYKIVAAKAWAALFAVGEWALRAETKTLAEPPPEKPKSALEQFREASQAMAETAELKREIEAFKPRNAEQLGKIPPRGKPEEYLEGTPERAIIQFLAWWKVGNYGKMASGITKITKPAHPSELKAWFEGKELLDYELVTVRDAAPARTIISVKLRVRDRRVNKEWTKTIEVPMIKHLDEGTVEELRAAAWTFFDYYSLGRP
jgi:hypothetical protein